MTVICDRLPYSWLYSQASDPRMDDIATAGRRARGTRPHALPCARHTPITPSAPHSATVDTTSVAGTVSSPSLVK
ncbi:hypothetical protein FHX80_114322 [Streptomyces brevispora]|uniref:Uncharacterized protein n=1 Tax=Streptomyces brevispora TaxID=887462 RepID=A0A561V2K5_9ACTN|nr:hypothetical protein FHX80_114322 [Streptomyces brevispora]